MRHFWIAFIVFLLAAALLGHGILTVWMRQVKVAQYDAETKRLEFFEFACSEYRIEEDRGKAFILKDTVYKCSDIIKNYVPTKEKVSLL